MDLKRRSAYVEEACRDDRELRQEVESLIVAHDSAADFMNTVEEPAWEEISTENVGDCIGRYQITGKIAEGGFGVIFRAEQREPVRRIVALKVIKPGMDSKEVIRRFELERQALAMMDHPNIAKVYDAGTTERGRPYFVMELVDGEPLTKYCDRVQLDLPRRLKLFAQICIAVQHAHQKGIIHRDLKPNNILVGESGDGTPHPTIIDFGVAKAIRIELTNQSFFTAFGRMMGTPRYMSPEQAELSPENIDTRTDIYSLGVILYELVTGSAPLRQKEIGSLSFDQVRRMICDTEPQKPSDRVQALTGEERQKAAQTRGLEEGRFWRQVQGDLDWVTMKALAKDQDRRYETANGLAVDVRRYLEGLPVNAGPPGKAYRLGKFVRRNRWPVSVAILSLLTLIAVIVAITMGYFMMREERNEVVGRENQRVELENERVRAIVEDLKKVQELRASNSGSREEALQYLGHFGLHPMAEIERVEGTEQAQKLRSTAVNELIACLLWTDLHESLLLEGSETSWTPAALDSTHSHCAVRGRGGRLEIIRATTGDLLKARESLSGEIEGPLRFNTTGELLIAGLGTSEQWKALIWRWREDQFVAEDLQGVHEAFDFHPSGDGFAVGTPDQTLQLFDANGIPRGEPQKLAGTPAILRYHPDGERIAIGIEGVGLVIIDLESGNQSVLRNADGIVSLAWKADGSAIVAGGSDGTVTVLEPETEEVVFHRPSQQYAMTQAAWSHDGLLIATGSEEDGVIYLWDSRQGELLCTFEAWAPNLSFSQNDKALGPVVPISKEGTLSRLIVQRSPVCHRVEGHSVDPISATTWTPDGAILATAADDGLKLWNRNGENLDHFSDDRLAPGGLTSSGTHFYLAEQDAISRYSYSVTGSRLECGEKEVLRKLEGGRQIALTPGDKILAVARDNEVVLLNAETGEILNQLSAPPTTSTLAVGPHENEIWIAVGTQKGATVRVWRLSADAKTILNSQDKSVNGAATVAFFPLARASGGNLFHPILMAGDDSYYRRWRWDPQSMNWDNFGEVRNQMADPEGRMAHIAYSPRGTALVVSYMRKRLQVLNPLTLEVMTEPTFEQQWPLSISPDGRLLATEAASGRLFIWNLAETRREMKLRGLDWKDLSDFPADTIPVLTAP